MPDCASAAGCTGVSEVGATSSMACSNSSGSASATGGGTGIVGLSARNDGSQAILQISPYSFVMLQFLSMLFILLSLAVQEYALSFIFVLSETLLACRILCRVEGARELPLQFIEGSWCSHSASANARSPGPEILSTTGIRGLGVVGRTGVQG